MDPKLVENEKATIMVNGWLIEVTILAVKGLNHDTQFQVRQVIGSHLNTEWVSSNKVRLLK